MKRFWLLVLLVAGSLVALNVPAFAQDAASDSTEDINSAIGALKGQMSSLQSQVNNIGLYGDVRLKYSWKTQSGVGLNAAGGANVIPDQDIEQIRVRLGFKKTFGDVEMNVRLSTDANSSYPSSQTPNLGDGLAYQNIYVDYATLSWSPSFLSHDVKVGGGMFPNVLDYTPITWDDSLQQDGAYVVLSSDDKMTKFTNVYTDLANPSSKNTVIAPAGVTPYNAGATISDAYIWNTQLSQMFKFDKDTNLNLTLGYEYIPYATNINNTWVWNTAAAGSALTTNGMVADYGNVISDVQMGEFIATFNNSFGADMPAKWTLHVIDNFDAVNMPNSYLYGYTITNAASVKSLGYSQLSTGMGYWLSLDLGKGGDAPAKDLFTEQIAVAYIEPNAQLSILTDHDGGYTNTEYLRNKFTFGLENNVSLQWKAWVEYHVYYEQGIGDTTTLNKLGSANQTPELVSFFYATASF